jgi:hypothetical protein
VEALVNAISEFLAALFARFGYVGRPRRRTNLRDEIKLLEEIRASPAFGPDTDSARFLTNHIANEVARYAGVLKKRKIPWSSVILAAIIGLPFTYWTYTMVRDGFVWYAVFPGLVAGFFLVGGLGVLLTGDDSVEDDSDGDHDE